jgi:hypothetical protein
MENLPELKFDKRRYQVAKTCPCGKSNKDGKFVPYKGFEDKGYCHSCGETFLPKIEKESVSSFRALRERKPETPPSYIAPEVFKKSLSAYDQNAFAQFLFERFGDIANKVIGRYFIGSTRTGGTVFWQIDTKGKIRSGKIIHYNIETGKRKQDIKPTWAHAAMKLPDFNLKQCLFGEHLIKNSKPCAIVESEKTACIASIYFPEMNWLACGGKDGLTAGKLQVLKNRQVILFPDLDGFELWTKKAEELKPMLQITVSPLLESKATPEERKNKLDIADYLLRFNPEDFQQKKPEPEYALDGTLIDPVKGYPVSWDLPTSTPLERMTKRNPHLKTLIDKLDLVQLN